MSQLFPYANIITGILLFIVGFIFHWIGQLISIVNWDYAIKIGLQEKAPEEYTTYENGIAKADVLLGWIYGIVAVGLILDLPWSYELVWIPGTVLIYHGFSYWFWTNNQQKNGINLHSQSFRVTWTLANLFTGTLAILIAWIAG